MSLNIHYFPKIVNRLICYSL